MQVLISRSYIEKTEDLLSESGEPPPKKCKTSGSSMWRVNTQEFFNFMRDSQIVSFLQFVNGIRLQTNWLYYYFIIIC